MSKKRAAKRNFSHLLTIDADLDTKVRDAAKKTKLSNQAVMRMSLDRGIDVLLTQLLGESAA